MRGPWRIQLVKVKPAQGCVHGGERKVGGWETFRPSAIPARQHAISYGWASGVVSNWHSNGTTPLRYTEYTTRPAAATDL